MSKEINFIANINKNSKKLIVDSNIEIGKIKENSTVKIGDENYFWPIRQTEELRVIKDFTVIDRYNIQINDPESYFVVNDYADISVKEYEFLTIEQPNIVHNFNSNQVVKVDGGVLSINSFDNSTEATSFKISMNGNLSILTRGKYYIPPENPCKISSIDGKTIEINLNYKQIDERRVIEKTITNIKKDRNFSIITLDSPLPEKIKDGKISTRKWAIHLEDIYDGENKVGITCSIHCDFTPHLKIPYVARNSTSHELLQNKAFFIIDQKIKELEQNISRLEK